MRAADGKRVLGIVLLASVAILVALGLLFLPQLHSLVHHYRLVGRLGSGDASERLNAAIELGAMGDGRSAPDIVAAMRTNEATNVRAEDEVAALCKSGDARTIRMLRSTFNDTSSNRARVIEALACIDDDAARAALADALRSGDDILLQTTVLALSESRDQRIVDLLVAAEKRAKRRERLAIISSLTDPTGHLLDRRLTAILAAALQDPDASIRIAAADSVAWNYLNKSVPAEMLKDQHTDVRNVIAGKLAFYRPVVPYDAVSADLRTTGDTADTNLTAAASRASAFLAARQDAAGYWLTYRTHELRFEHAYREMNTYLTPVIVDMLAPVADEAGLGDNVARARKQISGEIEDTGLVRYYGRSVKASSQRWNCAISPDADDTALAWRIAPELNPRWLSGALATLHQYRAPNGLYRTWLAPMDHFQCIDRGRDPDPTDVGIQMHMVMFLAHASPEEGRALCGALRKTIGEDQIWVYYRLEPLVPIIRQSDLEKVGCPVQVPDARLRTEIAGQGKWIVAGLMLSRLSRATGSDPSETVDLLRKLAQGDFLAIRRSPPLIYQNDATGSAPGYYWSPEFGYALWLRLYFENMHRSRLPSKSGTPYRG